VEQRQFRSSPARRKKLTKHAFAGGLGAKAFNSIRRLKLSLERALEYIGFGRICESSPPKNLRLRKKSRENPGANAPPSNAW